MNLHYSYYPFGTKKQHPLPISATLYLSVDLLKLVLSVSSRISLSTHPLQAFLQRQNGRVIPCLPPLIYQTGHPHLLTLLVGRSPHRPPLRRPPPSVTSHSTYRVQMPLCSTLGHPHTWPDNSSRRSNGASPRRIIRGRTE